MVFDTKKNLTNFRRKKTLVAKKLELDYSKPKYFNCEMIANYKTDIKVYKYNIYKTLKNHNSSDY